MNKTASKYVPNSAPSTLKVFCPDDWDFQTADIRITYRDSNVGLKVKFHVDYVDDYAWTGRKRQSDCQGGGYDMRGTVVGEWMMKAFPLETQLQKIGYLADRMYYVGDEDSWEHVKAPHIFQTAFGQVIVPSHSRLYGVACRYDAVQQKPAEYVHYDGACGFRQMENIFYHFGYVLKWDKRNEEFKHKDFYELRHIDQSTHYNSDHNVLLLPTLGNLVFRKEEQAIIPKGLEGEDLRDWLYDPNNVKHRIIKTSTQQVGNLSAVFDMHLGRGWSEYHYSREDGNVRWDATSSTRVGSSLRSIKSMTLLNDESGIKVIPFKELEI